MAARALRCGPGATYRRTLRHRRPAARRADPGRRDPVRPGHRAPLYPVACWLALAACLAVARYRNEAWKPAYAGDAAIPYLLVGALVPMAWPQLMRPMLDGDSLSYHFPTQQRGCRTTRSGYRNAILVVSAGVRTLRERALFRRRYIFAAVVRIRRRWHCSACARGVVAREDGAPPLLADAFAASAVTAYPLAIQAGTLQNDVWLAAFFSSRCGCCAWCANPRRRCAPLAVTALTKPQGWLLAAIALLAARAPAQVWFAAGGAVALWFCTTRRCGIAQSSRRRRRSRKYVFGSIDPRARRAGAGAARSRRAGTSPFAVVRVLRRAAGTGRSPRTGAWLGVLRLGAAFLRLPFGIQHGSHNSRPAASLRFAAPAVAAGAADPSASRAPARRA